jgi:hypothetical protein
VYDLEVVGKKILKKFGNISVEFLFVAVAQKQKPRTVVRIARILLLPLRDFVLAE